MSYGADAPQFFYDVPEAERDRRCRLTEDLCVVDDTHFFIRGSLELPVVDGDGVFVWGMWTSLSKDNFQRITSRWDAPDRDRDPPCFGWLSTALPYTPPTINLKTLVHSRERGLRPRVELEPTDHPLAVDQRTGVNRARIQDFAERLLHPELNESAKT
jgi:hypothetical protein